MQKYPFLGSAKVPANTYKGVATETKTVAVMAVLIVHPDIKGDIVYHITKALFEKPGPTGIRPCEGKENQYTDGSQRRLHTFPSGRGEVLQRKGVIK